MEYRITRRIQKPSTALTGFQQATIMALIASLENSADYFFTPVPPKQLLFLLEKPPGEGWAVKHPSSTTQGIEAAAGGQTTPPFSKLPSKPVSAIVVTVTCISHCQHYDDWCCYDSTTVMFSPSTQYMSSNRAKSGVARVWARCQGPEAGWQRSGAGQQVSRLV